MAHHVPIARRRFNVHPIQQKYFFLSLVPLFLFALFLIVLILFPLNWALMGPNPDPEHAPTLTQVYALMDIRVWLALLFSMLASCLLSYLVTNKFAGHLYRIEQALQRTKEGDIPRSLRIRRGDDLQEFVELLDGTFKTTTSALTAISEQHARAVEELTALQGKVQAGAAGDSIVKGLEGVGDSLKAVEKILANFKLPTSHPPDQKPPAQERA